MRSEQFAAELADDPDVTAEQVASDDNLFAIFAAANCVFRAHSRERISYFARLYANFLAGRGISSSSEFAEFLHLLESISEREFGVLLRLNGIGTTGPAAGSNLALFQAQGAWRGLRSELAAELGISEDEVNSIVEGLTRTGFCRVLPDNNSGAPQSVVPTAHLDRFLKALAKYDRTGVPKPPNIKVRPYVD